MTDSPILLEQKLPIAYRLIMQGDGNGNNLPVLQGLFPWSNGIWSGAEWRTLETQESPYLNDSIPFGSIGDTIN